jgi:hypothetical protein
MNLIYDSALAKHLNLVLIRVMDEYFFAKHHSVFKIIYNEIMSIILSVHIFFLDLNMPLNKQEYKLLLRVMFPTNKLSKRIELNIEKFQNETYLSLNVAILDVKL